MRRPKNITAKDRTKAAAGRIWMRHWLNGPEGQTFFRSVMDRAQGRALSSVFGVEVVVTGGKLARVTYANGVTHDFA